MKALQSDGYNVYMHPDYRMVDIEHLCCIAHARAKFKYGSYSIDNSIAEHFIRPLAGEQKNSLFFGSDRMAHVSAIYHTIISTCKTQDVSVPDYFKRFFSEIVKGRRDYEHLLPLTIGLD